MSRQLEIQTEERARVKSEKLVKVLDFALVGALENQGIELLGFAFKYDAYNSLMTIKAVVGGVQSVAFVGSDTLINCILKSESEAANGRLKWREDKYAKSGS